MTFWSDLKEAEHTAVHFFVTVLTKARAEEPKLIEVADRALPYVGQMAQVVVGLEAGSSAAAVVGKVVGEIQRDLDVSAAVIYDTGATPTAASMLGAIKANFQGLLDEGHISNEKSKATATKAINTLGALIAAVNNPPAAVTA